MRGGLTRDMVCLCLMNQAVEAYKNLAAVALAIFWVTTLIMIYRVQAGSTKTISSHAATSKKAAILFGLITASTMAMLILFSVRWFVPTFQFAWFYGVLLVAIWFLFGLAGVFPDTKNLAHRIHSFSATGASILLLPAIFLMALNTHIDSVVRGFVLVATVIMLVIGYLLAIKRQRHRVLIYEALYFLTFDIAMLVVTYWG